MAEGAVEEALEEEAGVVGEVGVGAGQEIGHAKTAVTPTLPGGRQKQLHSAVHTCIYITHCLL